MDKAKATAPGTNGMSDRFKLEFSKLVPAILEEWPEVDGAELRRTSGEYDEVVELIASATEHTRTLVRRQLVELRQGAFGRSSEFRSAAEREVDRLRDLLGELQGRSQEATNYVRGKMADDARMRVNENPITTLLTAIGLGFILGFILRGFGGRRG